MLELKEMPVIWEQLVVLVKPGTREFVEILVALDTLALLVELEQLGPREPLVIRDPLATLDLLGRLALLDSKVRPELWDHRVQLVPLDQRV